jgi:hypothetical protein
MPSRIEHRASFSTEGRSVYAVLVDPTFLTDRLNTIGGSQAALLDHQATAGEVTFRLRQGLAAELLPSTVRTFLKGDLVVTREETWRSEDVTGTVRATIPGVPGEISGAMRLVDLGADESELVTSAQIRVGIPLVGGKLESLIAEQVRKLLANESEFTAKWLAEHGR